MKNIVRQDGSVLAVVLATADDVDNPEFWQPRREAKPREFTREALRRPPSPNSCGSSSSSRCVHRRRKAR